MNIFDIEILEDGTVSIKTGEFSDVQHIAADALLDEIEEALGSKRQTKPMEHPFWKNKTVKRGGKIVTI
jgi:hypothetical protein